MAWFLPIPKPAAETPYVEKIDEDLEEDPDNLGGEIWVVRREDVTLGQYVHPGFDASYAVAVTEKGVASQSVSGFNYETGKVTFDEVKTEEDEPHIVGYRPRYDYGISLVHTVVSHDTEATGAQLSELVTGGNTYLHSHDHDHGFFSLEGWLAVSEQTLTLAALPEYFVVYAINVWVSEAFNSDGADEVTVGHDADVDAYMTSLDVSSTGVKSPTLGADAKKVESNKTVRAYYTAGGSTPTTGEVHVLVMLAHASAVPVTM